LKNYGTGKSTGIDQTAIGSIDSGFVLEDAVMSKPDKEVLQRLAERVAGMASSPEMEEKRRLWKAHNSLQKIRPLVFCDPENGWNEVITEDQMQCQGKLARRWEMDFRKEIFWAEEMKDDKPLDPFFNVPYTASADDWGLREVRVRTETLGSFKWDAPIKDYDQDLKKIHSPQVEIDWQTTNGCLAIAKDVFKGILDVRLKAAWWWSLGLTKHAVLLRGLETMFYDFVDHPEELKALLALISKGHMDKLDFLEKNHLLGLNNDSTYVGSGGFGNTDELPAKDFSGKARCRDMWGFAESQETVNVSPEMYQEFIFPFEKPILDRFGLNCYGCCEPLHSRWPVVKKHHNLRRVSCSPWADLEKMAEFLQDKYILSMKPSPSWLATDKIDTDAIRAELRRSLETTRGCVVEIIMKDNHTIGGRPENLTQWCEIARQESERIFSKS